MNTNTAAIAVERYRAEKGLPPRGSSLRLIQPAQEAHDAGLINLDEYKKELPRLIELARVVQTAQREYQRDSPPPQLSKSNHQPLSSQRISPQLKLAFLNQPTTPTPQFRQNRSTRNQAWWTANTRSD